MIQETRERDRQVEYITVQTLPQAECLLLCAEEDREYLLARIDRIRETMERMRADVEDAYQRGQADGARAVARVVYGRPSDG